MKLLPLLLAFLPSLYAQKCTNVALNQPTEASDVWLDKDHIFKSQHVVNGDKVGGTDGWQFYTSKAMVNPYLSIDLENAHSIDAVVVYYRPSSISRGQGYFVELSLAGSVVASYQAPDPLVDPVTTFEVEGGIVADTVRLYQAGPGARILELMEVEVFDCEGNYKASGSGDPHFKMWTGEMYDFHGACDLVLLQNPSYENGLGMDIHIRTKFTKQWSYISSAVLKIGDETLEIMGGRKSRYWINKVEGADISSFGFPIIRNEISSVSTQYDVELKDGSFVRFKTFKDFVGVEVSRANEKNYEESLGLMGTLNGDKMARDGVTVVKDNNAFGLEWQVLPSEPMLFHNIDGVQLPEKCPVPDQTESRRRLRESSISLEAAEVACARVSEEDRDSCIFDVMATNDKDMAGAY